MKKASIKDVALKAEVSTALVSYVMNNKHINRISKETAERVRQAAKELNYRPNKIAQSLKSNKTNTIALLVADISNPFASQIARIIEDETSKRGYAVLIGSSDENPEKLQQLIEVFLNRQVDGFIIIPVINSENSIKELIKTKIPVVLIDRYFNDVQVPVITTNNYGISYQSIEYLIKTGKKNIGILVYDVELAHLKERIKGYRRALEDRGLPFRDENIKFINEKNIQAEVEKAMDELLKNNNNSIDAIFFTTNKLAIAGLKNIVKRDIKIPQEIAILTFDESEAFEVFNPPLTYIKQPLQEISKESVEILMQIIENKNLNHKPRVFNSKLMIRQST
ncbi:LacI family transcriptional regulator [Apibacter muscae]|uniref:LacI family DNA-binding transcriptional regulator n=1 Tax=Apibacter muscae TaxID=2509004 RepID=UPI0011ACA190|nr:LacI family DNA-binding transcriptional regulator [Apibacter muscae]TWP24818.1 LacI family transcriptional regulator [Apibacter muscae]